MNSNTIDSMGPGSGQSMGAPIGANSVVGQYVLERPLGEGGMAEVWLGRNVHLGTPAAIKFLNQAYAGKQEIEQRFLNEGRRQGALNHPNIVKVYGFEYVGGRSYLILQYIDGEPLDRKLQRQGRLEPVETVRLATGVLNALECAHNNNIVHRDIKPSNILLDSNGFPYLGDFGIVLAMNEKRLTKTGTVMGTAYYMSPEQITSPAKVDHRADIYSFGCVLYEMLCGRPPFEAQGAGQGDTDFAVKMAHVQHTPPPLRQFNPALSPQIEAVVMRCLAKNPDYRWRSCAELRDALAAAVAGGVPQQPGFIQTPQLPQQQGFGRTPPQGYVQTTPQPGYLQTPQPGYVQTPQPGFQTPQPGFVQQQGYAQVLPPPPRRLWPAILSILVLLAGGGFAYWYYALRSPVTVENVAICQGTFNTEDGTCSPEAASRVLTVYAKFRGAKAGQTTMRNEWQVGGKVVKKPDPHILSAANGVYYQSYGTADAPGDYKVTVFADGTSVGTASVHVAGTNPAPANGFGIGEVSICQGTFETSTVTCKSDLSSRKLTVSVPYHNATPGQTMLRNEWELNGRVVQKPDPHLLRYESATYSYEYGTAAEPGDYKVTIYGPDSTLLGSASIHLGAQQAAGATFETVSICQGVFNTNDSTCRSDTSSKQLTVVSHFHGATPNQTSVTAVWELNGQVVQRTNPYALRYDKGFYYDAYTTNGAPGIYKAMLSVDGRPIGSAMLTIAPPIITPRAGLVVESTTICRGKFDGSTGNCENNPSSNLLTVVMRFHGATPGQTAVRAEWSSYGTVIQRSDNHLLKNDSGWYYQQFGTARIFGDYKVTVYVDGVPRGTAATHVGL